MKDVEYVVVPADKIQVWSEEEQGFIDNMVSTYYVINALGEFVFFKTSSRQEAKAKCDELYGVNKYTIRTSKDVKTKAKTEFGLTCTGTTSRRGSGSWLRKTV